MFGRFYRVTTESDILFHFFDERWYTTIVFGHIVVKIVHLLNGAFDGLVFGDTFVPVGSLLTGGAVEAACCADQ